MNAEARDLTRTEALAVWREEIVRSGWFGSCTAETVPVADALGRVTATPVMAARSIPHYAGAAMDGFALRFEDAATAAVQSPVTLQLAPRAQVLAPGTAVLVDTGDALPAGADSVIMREQVERRDNSITFSTPVKLGHHVRKIGEDIQSGEQVLPAGKVISPPDIAACMGAGADWVCVRARPVVTVIPTGDEIMDSPEELPAGVIREINSYMLAALFSSWGATVKRHSVVPDKQDLLRAAIAEAAAASDLVVTNGGTSGGSDDYTAAVFGSLGKVCCHGVAIRPGRPVVLAAISGKPVIGLPGYPVSCMLTAGLFLQELLHEFQQKPSPQRTIVRAKLSRAVESKPGAEEFVRVALETGSSLPVANPLARGSSLISTLTQAHGVLRIGMDEKLVEAGAIVEIELFPVC